ncbi:hypothetical protein ACFQPG_01185 [Sphingomonas sp. GCM10030256]|uniref:hypothetical protein n=1 Tax=Sphingomonas sp. GCM10030256 TaxID=3273427 RepID=UPI003614CE16
MVSPILIAALAVIETPPAEPAQAGTLNAEATELFDRDPQLKAWAVRRFDRNGDGWLSLFEAQPALGVFKEIADGNGDGRVTVREYQAAVEFIRARFAVAPVDAAAVKSE